MNALSTLILAAGSPVGHVTDKPIYGQWFISNVTVMLALSGIITCLLIIPAARRIATGNSGTLDDYTPNGSLANLVDTVCLYLRDSVFKPVLHDQTDRYIPVLWTFFFFILISNLLGLVPILDITAMMGINPVADDYGHYHPAGIGGTATQSIWVTGALATIAFFFINGTAFLKDPKGFCYHLTAGAPWYMWLIMVPVELMGLIVKPVALALRLFANMTGGHIIVATLFSFVAGLAVHLGGVSGHGLALIPLIGVIIIYFLEILVAFIQAYIFTFLTGLFLAQLVVHHHDEHEHPQADSDGDHMPEAVADATSEVFN